MVIVELTVPSIKPAFELRGGGGGGGGARVLRGGGGGGGAGWYSGFQVTGMMEWGQKSKPKNIPRASNKTPKIPWTKI